MQQITGYHGTNRERGETILENGEMKRSEGDKHWLGDGSYLFKDEFWAYKWIVDMYKERYNEDITSQKLSVKYQVLKIKAETNIDRIFDLDKARHRVIFEKIIDEICDSKKESNRYKDYKILDGVAINYLFNEFDGFKQKFDVVKARFVFENYTSNCHNSKTRLNHLPQVQYCIKNLDVIENINDYDYEEDMDYYEFVCKRFFNRKESVSTYIPNATGNNIYKE